jgi:hypothetical protein
MSIIINKDNINKIKEQEKPKGVFCSIPRTASNGITIYILDGLLEHGFSSVMGKNLFYFEDRLIMTGHSKYNSYINDHKNLYDGFKFAAVRNTYDRMVSMCEFFQQRDVVEKIEYENKIDLFKNYLYALKENREKEGLGDLHGVGTGLPQLMYIQNDDINSLGEYSIKNKFTLDEINIGVDYLLEYEHLEQDYAEMCDIFKIANKFGYHFNTKSKRDNTLSYYDTENKQIIEDMYGFEIEYFKFEIGD